MTCRSLWKNKPLNFPLDRVIFIDETSDSTSAFTPCTELTPKYPAMILYTSGTTGRPKGVLHRHEFLTHIVDWMNTGEGFDMSADSHVGLISRFTFVATITLIFGALLNGGTLYFAPEPARNDLELLYKFLSDKKITHIFIASGLAVIPAEDYDISGVNVFAAGIQNRDRRSRIAGVKSCCRAWPLGREKYYCVPPDSQQDGLPCVLLRIRTLA